MVPIIVQYVYADPARAMPDVKTTIKSSASAPTAHRRSHPERVMIGPLNARTSISVSP